jgi:hypothetical protein
LIIIIPSLAPSDCRLEGRLKILSFCL